MRMVALLDLMVVVMIPVATDIEEVVVVAVESDLMVKTTQVKLSNTDDLLQVDPELTVVAVLVRCRKLMVIHAVDTVFGTRGHLCASVIHLMLVLIVSFSVIIL